MRGFLRGGGRATSQAAIALAALALIALIWLGSIAALRANRAEVEAHAAAEIANEALIFADRMNEHLASIDQTLRFLERDWEANPEGFNLPIWRQRALILADASLQAFITDSSGIIRQATDPALIGKNVDERGFFRNRAALPSDDGQLYIDQAAPKLAGDGWAMTVARRLDLPDGSFAGVISVTYDMAELIHFDRQTTLGDQGLVEVVGTQDQLVRAASGGNAHAGNSIAGTAMAQAIARTPDGRWIGPSASDGLARLHAFHELSSRGLEVVLAMSVRDALRPSVPWERQALVFGSLTTVLVTILAGALLLEARRARRRVETLAREQAILADAKADADAKSQRLEVTLAGMSDGVMMMDANMRLVEWNSRFPQMIGLPPALPARGLPFAALLRAQAEAGEFGRVDVETEVAARIATIHAGGDSVDTERLRPDGHTIAVRRQRLADGSFVTIYTDITERKRNEDALRQARFLAEATSEAKSRFVAMVSHEIRQPLNALLNSLSLLAGSEMAPAPRRLVGTARQSGDALLGLLNDILEMSKMEAGQLTLRPDVFGLRPLLQGVIDMFADQAAARGMGLALVVADDAPALLLADPVRIRQILMNLLSNAVKFASPGRITLTAATETALPGMLRLTVRDPGPTIDPVGRARLFQPFVQLGDASVGRYAGTGLGLAICQTLAGLLGGEIGYEPTGDGGNAFWVRLAFAVPTETPVVHSVARPLYPRSRVLLVEDVRANQLVIATLLRREGHMVDIAASGSAAIRAVARQPYDLVLMDIFMPGMTGIEATRHIRALGGAAGAVPICALTGNASPEDRAACEAAGMNDIRVKPVELDTLLDVLGRLVWRHHRTWQPDMLEPPLEQPVVPLLMPSRLAELQDNLPPATLADLVEQALTELAERLDLLHSALVSADAVLIEAEAHAMAGLAGSYALAALEFQLQTIIETIRSGGMPEPASDTAILEPLLARSAAALRHMVTVEAVQ